jgi:hypothetical protein
MHQVRAALRKAHQLRACQGRKCSGGCPPSPPAAFRLAGRARVPQLPAQPGLRGAGEAAEAAAGTAAAGRAAQQQRLPGGPGSAAAAAAAAAAAGRHHVGARHLPGPPRQRDALPAVRDHHQQGGGVCGPEPGDRPELLPHQLPQAVQVRLPDRPACPELAAPRPPGVSHTAWAGLASHHSCGNPPSSHSPPWVPPPSPLQRHGDPGPGRKVLLRHLLLPPGGAEAHEDQAAAAVPLPAPQALQVHRIDGQVGRLPRGWAGGGCRSAQQGKEARGGGGGGGGGGVGWGGVGGR